MNLLHDLRLEIRLRTRLRAAQFRVKADRLFRKYQGSTMISRDDFIANLALVAAHIDDPRLIGGTVFECGTWRGGMSAALIELCGPDREYFFFDSFEGLPPAKELDGERAIAFQRDKNHPLYHDNNTASLAEFEGTIAHAGGPHHRIHIFKGYFDKTLPSFTPPPIALLRLDADWYDSTMICLSKFWDAVLPGGLVLIDDYYAWEGCSRAIHDFLSQRKATQQIRQAASQLAYILK
jgi:O-methyltransferase